MAQQKGFYRSRTDRVMGGICGGLAKKFGLQSGMVRLVFVLLTLIPGPQFIFYLAAWVLLPLEPHGGAYNAYPNSGQPY